MTKKKFQSKTEEKSSTRLRRWNYKPSNRYNISFLSNSKINDDDDVLLCENCANLNLNEQMKNFNIYKKISHDKRNSMKFFNSNLKNKKLQTSTFNTNFTKLGPIQRSLYVKNNVNNLISYKENSIKLCQLNSLKIDLMTRDYQNKEIKCLNEINKTGKREFDIITKNAIITKLNPFQLKNSKLMLNFLENYLDIKRK